MGFAGEDGEDRGEIFQDWSGGGGGGGGADFTSDLTRIKVY